MLPQVGQLSSRAPGRPPHLLLALLALPALALAPLLVPVRECLRLGSCVVDGLQAAQLPERWFGFLELVRVHVGVARGAPGAAHVEAEARAQRLRGECEAFR